MGITNVAAREEKMNGTTPISVRVMATLANWLNARHWRGQGLRTALAILGVVAGVSVAVFTTALSANLRDSLRLTMTDLAGKAPVEVRRTENGVPLAWLDVVRGTQGVGVAAPLVTGGGLMLGQPELLAFWGVDPAVDQAVRDYTITAGRFITNTGEVMLTQRYAEEKGIQVGAKVSLIGGGGLQALTVVGLLADAGPARLNSGDIAVMSGADAQGVGNIQTYDSIAIIPAAGADPALVMEALKARLDTSALVADPADRLGTAGEFGIVIEVVLTQVTLMIMVLSSSMVFNTVNVSIVQRGARSGFCAPWA